MTLLTIKQLSAWLNIKPSTLYLWASQGKIPCLKIHGLIRFEKQTIEEWLASFVPSQPIPSFILSARGNSADVDELVAAAKRDVYTPASGKP